MRPALVCGAAMYPSSSSTAMSLRTVADDTPKWCLSTSALEPTGSRVVTKSSMMARSTARRRSSNMSRLQPGGWYSVSGDRLALSQNECQSMPPVAMAPGTAGAVGGE
ncbi:unannotated protein [freshwater metagenome]|uniref:Unannotated protein n=1 Tax=freshwater metagenome TaxID=449393 RepID=A0A6J7KTR9_9ZZZZ